MLPISKASAHSYSLSVQYKLPQFSISYRCFIKTCLSVTVLPLSGLSPCLLITVPSIQPALTDFLHFVFLSSYWVVATKYWLIIKFHDVLSKCFSVACGLNVPYRWKKLRQDFIQRTEPESLCHSAVCLITRPPSVTVNPPPVPAAINATLVLYVED